MKWLLVPAVLLLSGCMGPVDDCVPEWYLSWEDGAWYEATLDHPDAQVLPASTFDLGIEDPLLDEMFGRHITRNLQLPDGEIYAQDGIYTLWVWVDADSSLEERRDAIAPGLQALDIDVDQAMQDLATERSVASSTQSGGQNTIHAYSHRAVVDPDIQGWYDSLGGYAAANVTGDPWKSILTWDDWRLQVSQVGHTIAIDEVTLEIHPSGRVQLTADQDMPLQDVLDTLSSFATQQGLQAPAASPWMTDCIIRESIRPPWGSRRG